MLQESAVKANRAIGAMFFSVFGAAWLIGWSLIAYDINVGIISSIVFVMIIIFGFSLRQYRKNRAAHAAEANSPESKKSGKAFNIVNASQWILIFIVANVLSSLKHSEWIIPAIMFIVGLHFLPLAKVFKYSRHYITGAALILLSVIYPLASSAGPQSSIGCFGAGIILWISAIGALTAQQKYNAVSTAGEESA